jgi:ATP-dependent RNA helicase DeaD
MSENNPTEPLRNESAPKSLEIFEMSTTENASEPVEQLLAQYANPVVGDVVQDPRAAQQSSVEQSSVEQSSVEQSTVESIQAPILCNQLASRPDPVATPVAESDTKPKKGTKPKKPKQKDSFIDLPLSSEVQASVQNSGYDTPTAVQLQIIPHMLEGRDVLAQSQTGTGKTAAFALPILSRLEVGRRQPPQVLVLAPTRELAIQVTNSFSTYAACMSDFAVAAIYGGQDYEPQLRQLRRGVHVVVGTPGRVIDHIRRGTLDLSGIRCLVLDEADEMLNMGFLEDVQFVLKQVPEQRQIALFSATLPGPICDIADQYLNDPVKITIKKKTMTAELIRQRALFVAPRDRIDVLTRILEVEETDGVIVFTKTRAATMTVAEQLSRAGLSAIALNGDMPQNVRERVIERLKSGQLDVLVATDVAARGLDVPRISHVFNYDLPHDSQSYIHRVGRTGRAGRSGEAIIFLSNAQRGKLRLIERATKQPIEVVQPPTTDDINAMRVKRFKQRIDQVTSARDLSMFKELIAEYAEESGKPLEMIAAALAQIGQQGRPFLLKDQPNRKKRDRSETGEARTGRDRIERNGRERSDRNESGSFQQRRPQGGNSRADPQRTGPPELGMTRYRIEVGRRDGVKPGNIVGAVANEAGIDGEVIGPIRIHDSYSTIDLPEGMPRDIYQTLRRTWVAGKELRLSDAGEQSGDSRPRRGGNAKPNDAKRAAKTSGGKPLGGKRFTHSKAAHNGKRKKRKTKA